MTVKERIRLFVKSQKISNTEFCQKIGVSNAFISSMRVSLQPDKIDSIALNYPQLNTTWLLTGEGPMLKENNSPINNNNMSMDEKERIGILEEALDIMKKELSDKQRTIDALTESNRQLFAAVPG